MKSITDLTPVVTPAGTDTVEVTQGGVSKKETLTQVVSLAGGGFSTVFKTADECITDDDTLSDDSELLITVAANSIYIGMIFIDWSQTSNTDFKWTIVGPSGSTIQVINTGDFWASPGDISGYMWSTPDIYINLFLGNGPGAASTPFFIETAGTAGEMNIQWAQNTSHANSTCMKKGMSWIMYKKVS